MVRSSLIAVALCLLGSAVEASAPPSRIIEAPGHGMVRALVIGIDQYHNVPALRGAVADARDIETALHTMGAGDITTLIDDQASRESVLQNLDNLLARTRSGDLVVVTLAGHGAKEDERIKGSSPDNQDEVFLLPGFDAKSGPGGTQKILNHEFRHYIRAFEDRNAQVLFVADTCYGGGLTRDVAFGTTASYRQVPHYRLVEDDLKPVSTASDAFLTPFDFDRTTFLAAVDDQTKAPEVMINGAYRGALSYAVARAIEGAADDKKDGDITLRELFSYARKVVYQLSNAQQNIVTMQSPKRNIDRDLVLQLGTRSVDIGTKATPVALPVAPAPSTAPLKIASLVGRKDIFKTLQSPFVKFEVVDPLDGPDVLYDPVSKRAVADNDVVAYDIGLDDLPGVLDRTAAVRSIKAQVVAAPQSITVLPNASLHRRGEQVQVQVGDAKGRNLVLVDITGNGTVQLLSPRGKNSRPVDAAEYQMPFQVREPFGDDAVVAITSKAPMDTLVAALSELDGLRAAGKVAGIIEKNKPADAKVGLVGLFTVY